MQVPVNKVQTFSDLRNVLMKRIFLSALHFRINTRYKVRLNNSVFVMNTRFLVLYVIFLFDSVTNVFHIGRLS